MPRLPTHRLALPATVRTGTVHSSGRSPATPSNFLYRGALPGSSRADAEPTMQGAAPSVPGAAGRAALVAAHPSLGFPRPGSAREGGASAPPPQRVAWWYGAAPCAATAPRSGALQSSLGKPVDYGPAVRFSSGVAMVTKRTEPDGRGGLPDAGDGAASPAGERILDDPYAKLFLGPSGARGARQLGGERRAWCRPPCGSRPVSQRTS